MFCYETSKVILIIIILISKDIQILSLDLQFNDDRYDLKTRFKRLKEYIEKHENKKELDENSYGITLNEFETQTSKSFKRENFYEDSDKQQEKNSLENLDFEDQSYEYDVENSSPSKIAYTSEQIYRREVPSKSVYTRSLQNSSLYPSVLTKALEISFNPSGRINTEESLFSNVAQKMNTSTLDLAKKITNSETSENGNQFAKTIQNYIKTPATLNSSVLNRTPTQNLAKNFQLNVGQEFESNEEIANDYGSSTTSSLAAILDQILNKLESIHTAKNNDEEEHPEGAPCDIIGSWSSTTMGLCFDIQLIKEKIRDISLAELNNKILSISVSECVPAKRHQIIDLDWKFTGSAIKQWGGPFHVYGQKRREGIIATFLGFCRKCGGIDTVFGSWNLLSPSKDCHDISLASEVKQDILRRVRMETKRKERFKDLLYRSHHGKL